MRSAQDNRTRELAINAVIFLRQHLRGLAIAVVVLPALGGLVYALWTSARPATGAYYQPGVTPSREECVLAKMRTYAKIDRQTLQGIAAECELTVQSIEGHEVMRKAWEARQAARQAVPRPAPAPVAAEPPPESDRLRRVWR